MSSRSLAIHLHELELLAHVGVTDAERARAQRLVLNITVYPRDAATTHDDINHAVNYSAVAEQVHDVTRSRAVRLIETLAADIADRLLARFPVCRVIVEVRKFVLPNTSHVSVTVSREIEP